VPGRWLRTQPVDALLLRRFYGRFQHHLCLQPNEYGRKQLLNL
jgi:hypothetical protein